MTRSLISSKYVFVTAAAALSSHRTRFFPLSLVEVGAHYCLFVKKKRKKRKGHEGACAKKEKKHRLVERNQDYACPRYQENSNETEQR